MTNRDKIHKFYKVKLRKFFYTIQNFSSISVKLCLLGQKNMDMGCEYLFIYFNIFIQGSLFSKTVLQ